MSKKTENQIALPLDDMPEIHIVSNKPSEKKKAQNELPEKDELESEALPFSEEAQNIEEENPVAEQTEDYLEDTQQTESSNKAIEEETKEDLSLFGTPMSSIKPKPKILLETPYKVSNQKGEHMRYHLEYDYADKSISPEHVSLLVNTDNTNLEHPQKPIYLEKKKKVPKNKLLKEIFDWTKAIVIAILLTLFIRQFVFVIVTVDGPSMQPNLQTDERLIVTRYDFYLSAPKRGEIIICRFPDPRFPDRYVKRVIGLPGDTIEVKSGVTYINGQPLAEPYIHEPANQDFSKFLVPADTYFVMGDNRNDSSDSRVVGPIPKNDLIGRARYIVYPFDNFGKLED